MGAGLPTQGHRPDVAEVVGKALADVPGVRAGKMFGFPAFFMGRKLWKSGNWGDPWKARSSATMSPGTLRAGTVLSPVARRVRPSPVRPPSRRA